MMSKCEKRKAMRQFFNPVWPRVDYVMAFLFQWIAFFGSSHSRVTRSYKGRSCGGRTRPSSIKHRMSHRCIVRHTPQPHLLLRMVSICFLHQTLRHNHSCSSSCALTNTIQYFTFIQPLYTGLLL